MAESRRGGAMLMNRCWGREKVKPASVGVSGTPCCADRCVDGRSAPVPVPTPAWRCQTSSQCSKRTDLFLFVLCYFWTQPTAVQILSFSLSLSLSLSLFPCIVLSLSLFLSLNISSFVSLSLCLSLSPTNTLFLPSAVYSHPEAVTMTLSHLYIKHLSLKKD